MRFVRWKLRQAGSHSSPHAPSSLRNAIEIGHGLLIVDPEDRCGQDPIPVRGEPAVLPEPQGNVAAVVRPSDASEIVHPAGDCDIAKVPAAVDEDRVGEHRREKPDVEVIIGKLVDDPVVPSQVQGVEFGEVLPRKPLQRTLIERGDAVDGWAGSARDEREPFRRIVDQTSAPQLRKCGDGWPGFVRRGWCRTGATRR